MNGAERDASILQRCPAEDSSQRGLLPQGPDCLCVLLPCPEGDQLEARSTGLKAEWRSGDRSPRERRIKDSDERCFTVNRK
jgi:hypothetical protein